MGLLEVVGCCKKIHWINIIYFLFDAFLEVIDEIWLKKRVISLEAHVTLSPDTKVLHGLLKHPVCVSQEVNTTSNASKGLQFPTTLTPGPPFLSSKRQRVEEGSWGRAVARLLIIFLLLSTHHHWQIYVKRLTHVAGPRLEWLFSCCDGVSGRSLLSLRPFTPSQYFGFYCMYLSMITHENMLLFVKCDWNQMLLLMIPIAIDFFFVSF